MIREQSSFSVDTNLYFTFFIVSSSLSSALSNENKLYEILYKYQLYGVRICGLKSFQTWESTKEPLYVKATSLMLFISINWKFLKLQSNTSIHFSSSLSSLKFNLKVSNFLVVTLLSGCYVISSIQIRKDFWVSFFTLFSLFLQFVCPFLNVQYV